MYKCCDVFPEEVVCRVERLAGYPKIGTLIERSVVRHFCLYMDATGKIYYHSMDFTDAVKNTVRPHYKEAQKCHFFSESGVDWIFLTRRFRRPVVQGEKKNADVRTGYKIGGYFLVKAFFTFGLRRVREGTAHVLQTLEAPLLFYLRPVDLKEPLKERHLPEPACRYDRRVLEPNTCYRIPPGAAYFLMSCQKNFFRMDVVRDGYRIPFPHVDPVLVRVTKLTLPYDRPVKTPYIEDRQDEAEFPETFLGREGLDDLIRFEESRRTEEPMEGATLPEPEPTFREPVQTFREPVQTFQGTGSAFQGTHQTFLLIPGPPVLERTVTVAPAEFVPLYRSLREKTYGPPREELPLADDGWEPRPLDLSAAGCRTGSERSVSGDGGSVPEGVGASAEEIQEGGGGVQTEEEILFRDGGAQTAEDILFEDGSAQTSDEIPFGDIEIGDLNGLDFLDELLMQEYMK